MFFYEIISENFKYNSKTAICDGVLTEFTDHSNELVSSNKCLNMTLLCMLRVIGHHIMLQHLKPSLVQIVNQHFIKIVVFILIV